MRTGSFCAWWRACVLGAACAAAVGLSQTSTGSITGVVTDPSGSVIPQAQVVVTNRETGRSATLVTNTDGVYEAASLPAGTYNLKASQSGFKTLTVSGLKLDPGARINHNLTLEIGAVEQSVDVVAAGAQVNTATGDVSGTIETSQLERIEVNGRNFQSMMVLVPGMNNTSAGKELSGLGLNNGFVISSNGLGTNKNVNMVDGSFNMNTGCECAGPVNPEMDTLSEVRIMTNNYSARYGYAGGAQVLVETKSGQSSFHGQAQEYVRNDAFDARNFFSPSVSPLKQNIFGYEIGGPVFIPGKLNRNRDKTFFFFGQNWRIVRRGLTLLGATPTPAMRGGDFQAEAARTGKNILDPLSNTFFPNNQIPASRFEPNAVKLMGQLLPQPNRAGGGFLNYLNDSPDKTRQQQEVVRLDHNFSDKFRVMLRYIQEDVYNTRPANQFGGTPFRTIGDELDTFGKNAYIQLTNVISPSAVNTFGFSYSQTQVEGLPTGAFLRSPDMSIRDFFPGANTVNYVPDLTFSGGWSFIGVSSAITLRDAPNLAYTFTDDFSKTIGRHTLTMGLFYNLVAASQNTFATIQGGYTFTGSYTNNPIADFLLGQSQFYIQDSKMRRGQLRYPQVEPYFQDDWKVSRRLTLNLGLRYSYQPPWRLQQPVTGFDPRFFDPAKAPQITAAGILNPTSKYDPLNGLVYAGERELGITEGFSRLDEKLWQPRVGVAWDVFGTGKTAVRGGYGISYYRTEDQIFGHLANPPFVQRADLFNTSLVDPSSGSANPLRPAALSITPYDSVPTRVQSFSAGIEQQLNSNLVLRALYAGNRVSRLPWTHDINQVIPGGGYDFDPRLNANSISVNALRPYLGYAGISGRYTDGFSNYNSLQVSLVRRYSQNLSFQVAYTYGRSLGQANDMGGAPQNLYNLKAEYGPFAYDRTHMLNIGYVYDLPFFRGQHTVPGKVLGGWGLSGLMLFNSGLPLTPGLATSDRGLATRPDATGQPLFGGNTHTPQLWFDPAAFAAPKPGFYGNAGVRSIRGPGLVDWDFSLTKRTSMWNEKLNTEFRAGFFNVLNHTNFLGVSTSLGAGNFGQVVSALDPRIMEFGFRVWF
ncbi:MAG TPA: carboxypeptidase-like regulatory domain-containing protein [Bryobacteraceae bacterium]|nr:carboxypeptidase-like regulatory domain-containing protein [Bryobacteraceae bacterium]